MSPILLQRTVVFALCALVLPVNAASADLFLNESPLKVENKKLNKVVVNADPLNRNLKTLMSPVQVLSDAELQARNSASIGETLSQSAGVHNASFGNAVGRPIMRGLGGARVKVMQNGIDSMDVATISPDHAVAVDSQSAVQIEILRGPSALIYGSEAMSGAVNVVDKRIPTNVQYNQTKVASELSSVDAGTSLSLSSQYTQGAYAAQVSMNQRKQSDYALAKGDHEKELHNSALKLQNINAGVAWFNGNFEAGFAISKMHHEFGLPGHGHHDEDALVGEEDEEAAGVTLDQTRLDINSTLFMNKGLWQSLNWKMGLVDYEHSEGHEEADDESAQEPAHVESEHEHTGKTHFKRRALESRLSLNYKAQTAGLGVIGLQLNNSDFSAKGSEAVVPNTHSNQLALFAMHSLNLSAKWNVEVAARAERFSHDVDKAVLNTQHLSECGQTLNDINDRTFNLASISSGLHFKANQQLTLTSNISGVKRAPAAQELYSCGPHESSLSFEIGDSNLQNESALTLDAGLNWQLESLQVNVSIYRNNFSNFIYQQNLNKQIDELNAYQYAQQDAHLQGYEININQQFNNGWHVQMFADSVVAKFDSGAQKDQYLPRMPADRVGLEIGFNHYVWHTYARVTHYQDQDKLAAHETPTQGFDLLNLGVNYVFHISGGELKTFAVMQNALDEEMAYHTSFVKDEVSQPGRNIKLGVSYSF